mmetsp:Transcript_36836/g.108632  ORF Transcript_36836/g.108632 Transcript_36836/m.108632 type:complete len:246 (+) Transcript_36836:752-1489(+)
MTAAVATRLTSSLRRRPGTRPYLRTPAASAAATRLQASRVLPRRLEWRRRAARSHATPPTSRSCSTLRLLGAMRTAASPVRPRSLPPSSTSSSVRTTGLTQPQRPQSSAPGGQQCSPTPRRISAHRSTTRRTARSCAVSVLEATGQRTHQRHATAGQAQMCRQPRRLHTRRLHTRQQRAAAATAARCHVVRASVVAAAAAARLGQPCCAAARLTRLLGVATRAGSCRPAGQGMLRGASVLACSSD